MKPLFFLSFVQAIQKKVVYLQRKTETSHLKQMNYDGIFRHDTDSSNYCWYRII